MKSIKSIKWYMAGPMSGIPQFNIPTFDAAAGALRKRGYRIVSPAERDTYETRCRSLASPDGNLEALTGEIPETWGDMLARDMKIITDEVQGIILLPGWEASRGARLEAYIGLMAGCKFAIYVNGRMSSIEREVVKAHVAAAVAHI